MRCGQRRKEGHCFYYYILIKQQRNLMGKTKGQGSRQLLSAGVRDADEMWTKPTATRESSPEEQAAAST
jgi:hypothetical protein